MFSHSMPASISASWGSSQTNSDINVVTTWLGHGFFVLLGRSGITGRARREFRPRFEKYAKRAVLLGSILGVVIPLIFCVGLVACFVAPCCFFYKKCRKGRNSQRQNVPTPPLSLYPISRPLRHSITRRLSRATRPCLCSLVTAFPQHHHLHHTLKLGINYLLRLLLLFSIRSLHTTLLTASTSNTRQELDCMLLSPPVWDPS
ncbi:uncharacterized protein LOC133535088 [Nerophis ophidion]|uniref:uncharacterized protein LOC133535088 n=1 Tax=Nerophis ophidion TaxID=159077 RepID=UPI002AE0ADDE|nr:uncharacterized protein LOC133535088 [Nerophis ophidion]